jgi:hypothetical protein
MNGAQRNPCLFGSAITGALPATLRITDDDKVWETPLATFIEHNEGDDESCDAVRALPVGGSVVLGFGMNVERVS